MEEIDLNNLPKHIAIIMDGNRRWAKQKGLEAKLGHKAGADALEKITLYANKIGIKYLTVYAFSTENWKRTEEEIGALMILLEAYLNKFAKRAKEENIQVRVLGDIEVLNESLKNKMKETIELTKDNTGLTLNIAFNYGGRAEIVKAVKDISKKVLDGKINLEDINEAEVANSLYTHGEPDPDLVIRTGGELRTSNFLPWQIVYSEFYFVEKYWPDFDEESLIEAIKEYQRRNRRFGAK
ncbi:MAG: isoprenyl transferase [Clostridia bacterium]|nr:isoprenyl transferase [Clostridia bacterium]